MFNNHLCNKKQLSNSAYGAHIQQACMQQKPPLYHSLQYQYSLTLYQVPKSSTSICRTHIQQPCMQ